MSYPEPSYYESKEFIKTQRNDSMCLNGILLFILIVLAIG